MGIPMIIHQIWFQGRQDIPGKYQAFRQTWLQQGCPYHFWEEESIKSILSSNDVPPLWKRTYDSFHTMIQKIDFAKYVILYLFGGIYLDMDIFAIRPLSDLDAILQTNDFVVFKHNTPCITITMNKMMGLHGNILINNAVIFCTRKNEKIVSIINACCKAQQGLKKNFISSQLKCLVTTGPILFTNEITRFQHWKSFVMPARTFEPFTTLQLVNLRYDDVHQEVENPGHIDYVKFMQFLTTQKDMNGVIGIHVLDLNWFKNGKNNWKFRAYKTLQKMKKNMISHLRYS